MRAILRTQFTNLLISKGKDFENRRLSKKAEHDFLEPFYLSYGVIGWEQQQMAVDDPARQAVQAVD